MRIKAILFDMFDTLMMIEHNHQFYVPSLKKMHKILEKSGINETFDNFLKAYTRARIELYEKADPKNEEPHFNERIVKALEFLGYNYSKDNSIIKEATFAFCKEFMKYVRIDKDSKIVLSELSKKYELGIVSNFAIPECVIKLLQENEINDLFNVVIISGDINKRKPSPEIFETALNALRITAAEAVFVGDTLDADIKGAIEVGMKTIFIERRIQKEKETINPDITIKSLKELLLIIE
jgi:putative hydrolase of the HAD superfamily